MKHAVPLDGLVTIEAGQRALPACTCSLPESEEMTSHARLCATNRGKEAP